MKNKAETFLALFIGIQFLLVLIFFHKELGPIGSGIIGFGLVVIGMYVENSHVRSILTPRSGKP